MVRLVNAMQLPAYITGQRWDILAWNSAAAALFADFGRLPHAERNILIYMLTDPQARSLFGRSWTGEARRMIDQFRTDFDVCADDPAFAALVKLLRARSTEFRKWWSAHDVRPQAAGRKLLHHPIRGDLIAEYVTLQSNDDWRLKLVMYLVTTEKIL
jgi:hypothetical protein